MENRLDMAREYGFTEAIDCDMFSVHIFHEDYLEANTHSNRVISLASVSFSGDNVPCLRSSELEIVPQTEETKREIVGYIDFDMPLKWWRGEQTSAVILKKMWMHLASKIEYAGAEFAMSQNTLAVKPSEAEPLYVHLPETTIFEVYGTLDQAAPAWYQYDQVVNCATLWGHLHDFVAHDGDLPYRTPAHIDETSLFVGETTAELELSHTELIMTSIIEELRAACGSPLLPVIGSDISPETIDEVAKQLSEQEIRDATMDLVYMKRRLHAVTGKMTAIDQGDIIAAFAQQLRNRLQ